MNTSHHSGGAPDVFYETARAITAADVNANTVSSLLREKWIEISYLAGPDGKPLSWDNLVVNKGKKRVTLHVHVDPTREFVQDDWACCEYLDHQVNVWFEGMGSRWAFRYLEVRK